MDINILREQILYEPASRQPWQDLAQVLDLPELLLGLISVETEELQVLSDQSSALVSVPVPAQAQPLPMPVSESITVGQDSRQPWDAH